jgi:uncharacterized protein (TIGR04141 family)
VYTRVDLDSFTDIAETLYAAYQKKTYQKSYPWIDKITQERDAGVVKLLDGALVQKINQGQFEKIWLAIPEILNWEEIDGFSYRAPPQSPKKAGPVLHPDIDLESWLKETKLDGQVTLDNLCSKKIFKCIKNGMEPSAWKVYRCLNAEIDLKLKKYRLFRFECG